VAVLKTGVLISGRGSNLLSLIKATQTPGFPAQIACVVADKEAAGLDHAKSAGIPVIIVRRKEHTDKQAFEQAITKALEDHGVQMVCLAGFMRLLSADFVNHWLDRLINIHPSLLPAFPGLDVHQRVLDSGVKFTGCTVHFVRAEMDNGPVIIQAAVPVHQEDDEEKLAVRVLEQEHRIYPAALRMIAEGRVNVHAEKTFIAEAEIPEAVTNPAV
jgi:phosphoribosylglycinamide formyltransferase-1